MKQVYLDNAATTAIRPEVIERMTSVMMVNYGNASSTHSLGRGSKVLIEQARKNIAKHLNCSASEIVFTAGGTEADNLVLQSAVRDLAVTHIVSSKIEHHAVLHTIEALRERHNIKVSYVELNDKGTVNYTHLEKLLQTDRKTLVSLMHVNNEIGNLLDIKRVGELCKANNALFHSDTVQGVGHFKIDLQEISIDFLAASAHKFHGPKGVGFAFVRKDSGLKPIIIGGEQERGFRAGTEAIHNIVGLDEALNLAYDNLDVQRKHILELKHYFVEQLKLMMPEVKFNGWSGNLEKSTYTMVSVCLPIPPEKASMLLFQLDLKGIACSKGSACQSGSTQSSHVLAEILNEDDLQKPSIRFSFSRYNIKKEVDYVVGVLKEFAS